MIRVAYLCEPQYGGTFRFFTRIRSYLQAYDIELICIPPMDGDTLQLHPLAREEGIHLVRLSAEANHATRQIIDELLGNACDAIMILPGCDSLSTNLPCYLPAHIRCIARLPLMTEGVYRPARVIAPWINHAIAVSPRVKNDIIKRGFSLERVSMIPNGIDVRSGNLVSLRSCNDAKFHLLYVGRLEEMQKNILLLPRILRRILSCGVSADLTIVGEGPDRVTLEREILKLGVQDYVWVLGAVPLNSIRDCYAASHVFIFTSRYEGSPNAMLEAMSEGCVPVATFIRNLTDYIVENGVHGFLSPMGSSNAFCDAIISLARDRARWAAMSIAAQKRIMANFSIQETARAYAEVIQTVCKLPDERRGPLSLSQYAPRYSLRAGWKSFLPPIAKVYFRRWIEKIGWSV